MSGGRVVVTDSAVLLQPGIALLRGDGVDVEVLTGGNSDEKVAAGRKADALLVGAEPLTAGQIELISEAGRLGFIVRCGVGYDIVDVATATRHGIWVANVPDYCTDEVADHTLALLLAAARRLPYFLSSWRSGWDWSGADLPVPRLRDTTLGLVGAGRIGRAVAARATGFGMRVVASDPREVPDMETMPLSELLRTSDFVSLHCPLTAETHHLMSDETFALMKQGSTLINTSRGGLVDSEALLRALGASRPAMAALDVLDGEPQPDLGQPLLSHPQVLVTPHVAYYSAASKRDLALMAARNVLGFLRGERPSNLVNPQVLRR